MAAYNEELKHWTFIQKAAGRNAGTFTLDVTPFSGKPVQTYIGFMSADRKKVATSWYTGLVNILVTDLNLNGRIKGAAEKRPFFK